MEQYKKMQMRLDEIDGRLYAISQVLDNDVEFAVGDMFSFMNRLHSISAEASKLANHLHNKIREQ